MPSFTGGGLEGFMVRGRSVGFVTGAADMRTYAHELGHGVFGLEHTFPEIAVSTTNNLMDYGTGTHLTHEQWKIMHARKPAYSWFDSEEDGASINGCFTNENLINADKIVQDVLGGLNYPITLPVTESKNILIRAVKAFALIKTNVGWVEGVCLEQLVIKIHYDISNFKYRSPNIYSVYYQEAINTSTDDKQKADLILTRSVHIRQLKKDWDNASLNLVNKLYPVLVTKNLFTLTKLFLTASSSNTGDGDIMNYIETKPQLFAKFNGNLTAYQKLQFIAEFKDQPKITVWDEFVNESDLIDVWKNIDYLKEHRGDVEFLIAIKKVKDDDVWKHIVGEVYSSGTAVGGHILINQSRVNIGGEFWIYSNSIRFKVSDIQLPTSWIQGMEIKKAKK